MRTYACSPDKCRASRVKCNSRKKKCRNYSFFSLIDFALVSCDAKKLLARTYKLVPAAKSKHLSLSFLTFFSFTVAITSVLWKLHHQCTVTRRRSIDCVQLAVHKRKVPNPTNPLLWHIARRSKKFAFFDTFAVLPRYGAERLNSYFHSTFFIFRLGYIRSGIGQLVV